MFGLKKKLSLQRTLCADCADAFSLLRSLTEPLVKAARHGHIECVKVLIEAGADGNKQNKYGSTALVCAAEKGHVNCVNLLIEAGADVNQSARIVHVAYLGDWKFFKRTNLAGHTPLTRAARIGDVECVNVLINAGADVNKQVLNGLSALMEAAAEGNGKCVKSLLEAGADVNAVSCDGRTVLAWAALLSASSQCVRLLLRAGAKINITFGYHHKHNALQHFIFSSTIVDNSIAPNKTMVMLLYAAGESVDDTTIERTDTSDRTNQMSVPDYLNHDDLKLNLKNVCRQAIRHHLLHLDPHENLFIRIPRLGLPGSLASYLLYNMSQNDVSSVAAVGKNDNCTIM